jgi:hypothetical protein
MLVDVSRYIVYVAIDNNPQIIFNAMLHNFSNSVLRLAISCCHATHT